VDVSHSDTHHRANIKLTNIYKKIQNGSKPPFQKPLIIIILNNKPHNVSTDVSFYIYDRPLTGVHVVAGFCAYKV